MSDEARPRFAAVVPAGGSSSRMGGQKKEYRRLDDGRTVLEACVSAFLRFPAMDLLVVVVPPGGESSARDVLSSLLSDSRIPILFAPGGATRRRSVHSGLKVLLPYDPEYVLIHDGARPWLDADLIGRIVEAVTRHDAVIPVLPLVETPKELDADGFISRHLVRSSIGAAQTPQAFRFQGILRAHEIAEAEESGQAAGAAHASRREYTDDAELWGAFVGPVATVAGAPSNKKITFPEDLAPRMVPS